ncbi:MAG: hypothetical protein H6741_11775 [Alphaproteobacteria bacterium]|nr:hypothetical protein [Alphaproteobacteria bacterium]MCB9793390.1 hypothetical protein [Alphaproteobacteria bacterium]
MRSALILALGLSACAARQVKLGDALAEQGNWIAAYDSYEAAQREHPNSKRAAEGLSFSAPFAAGQLCERAEDALESGDPEWAWNDLARAHRIYPSAYCIAPVEERLVQVEVGAAMEHMKAGELEQGYRVAWRTYGRYPQRQAAQEAVFLARDLTLKSATLAWEDDAPHVALSILALNPAIEGEELERVASLRFEITRAWAQQLTEASAADRREGRPASAYLHAHMAAALSGGPKEAEVATSTREALHAVLDLPVALRVRGGSPRPERFSAAIRQDLSAPALSWVTKGSAGLVIEAQLDAVRCENSSRAFTELVQYEVIEQVPNEDWLAVDEAIAQLRRERDAAAEELTFLRGQRAGLGQAFEATTDANERAGLAAQLESADATITQRSQEQVNRGERLAELEGQLAATPRLRDVRVPREAPLLVEEHRRVCSAAMSMLLSAPGLEPAPYSVERSVEVTDRVHGPLPVAGLPPDPLGFPRGDNELGAELDAVLAREAAAQARAALGRLRNQAMRSAREADESEAAARAWIRAWWLSEGTPEGMQEGLDAYFPGLELRWLIP